MKPLGWLWDAESFTPRAQCGAWSDGLVAASKCSDLAIALAYLWIPTCIGILWLNRRRDITRPGILLCFGAFILLCGWTHLNDVLVFHWPAYRFFVAVKAATAAVSTLTGFLLVGAVRWALDETRPSWEQLKRANDRAQQEILAREMMAEEMRLKLAGLADRLDHYRRRIESREWAERQSEDIKAIKAIVATVREGEGR